MGRVMEQSKADAQSKKIREMVTPTIRKNLEKQGYKIVGSHSGVKLCRWTKVHSLYSIYMTPLRAQSHWRFWF